MSRRVFIGFDSMAAPLMTCGGIQKTSHHTPCKNEAITSSCHSLRVECELAFPHAVRGCCLPQTPLGKARCIAYATLPLSNDDIPRNSASGGCRIPSCPQQTSSAE